MKKILFILVVVFSLFFVVYISDQVDMQLHFKWVMFLVWLVVMAVINKLLYIKKKDSLKEESKEIKIEGNKDDQRDLDKK